MSSTDQSVSLSELVPPIYENGIMKSSLKNRTIFTRDNLEVMRGMADECTDLIYLDPPFNSNHNYAAPIGSQAAGAEFKDTWTLDEIDLAWHGEIAEAHPGLYKLLEATREIHGASMMAYLIYMAVRVIEMRRILKPAGSIYLHCDPTASHYLKLLMDEVFGKRNFRSHVTWRRVNPTGRGSKRYANNVDHILYYVNSGEFVWNQPHRPYEIKYITKAYRHLDLDGRRYRLDNLKGAGTRTGSSGMPWRGVDPNDSGSHWAVPNRLIPEELRKTSCQDKLNYLDNIGRIYWPPNGTIPSYKRYLDEMPGTPIDTLWDDIGGLQSNDAERTGYPTQKPLALLERIIKASSNEGDMVLDPFCGCATTCVAAEKLNREWIGIDVSSLAARLVQERIERELGILLFDPIHRTDIPQDRGGERSKDIKHELYGRQEGICNGCLIHFPYVNLTVDHIVPKSKGGADVDENLQLLCARCNSVKGNRTQEYLISQVRMTA